MAKSIFHALITLLLSVIMISSLSIQTASKDISSAQPQNTTTTAAATATTRVTISNQVGPGKTITVYCAIKGKEMDRFRMWPNTSFHFDFDRSNLGSALKPFVCQTGWDGVAHAFNAYDPTRDQTRCTTDCCLILFATGPCDCYNTKKCFPWNDKKKFTEYWAN